jgi:outer membrane immunogenic protein
LEQERLAEINMIAKKALAGVVSAALLASGGSIVTASSALAADAVVVIPPAAPAPPTSPPPAAMRWSGFYVGIQGGWQRIIDEVEDPIPSFAGTVTFGGAALGVHAGFDFQRGPLVVGVIGDIEWAGGTGISPGFAGGDVYGLAAANWQGSVRARFGVAGNRVMVYATGGLAFGNFDFDYTCCNPAPVFGQGDQFTDTVWGYTVGGGLAVAASPSLIIWADYRFTNYREATSTITVCCAPPPNSQDHDVRTHTFRVGISRLFGGGM